MYEELIAELREEAEWAKANEWETPIMLSDHLKQAADAIEELATFKEQITDGHFYCMRDGVLYEAKVDPPKGKVFHLPQIEFQEPPKENEKSET